MAKPTKRPTKHKIVSGTTDKVTPTGGPRQPVKKISGLEETEPDTTDEVVDEVDEDEVDDDVEADEADAKAKGGTEARRKRSHSGGVRKVETKAGKTAKPESKHSSKRVTEKGTQPKTSSRYTPPTQKFEELPSPLWVPILMFTLFGLGMLTIFLNYVAMLPGATSNWYLLLGLGFILAGIITATQYR